MATTLLKRVDGSALWSEADTQVLTSATGPIEVRGKDALPDAASIELVFRPLVGLTSK